MTLRQHLLFFLFPLDLLGSRKGFPVWALRAGAAPRSCSRQHGRPSRVEPRTAPSWCCLQNELGQKWQKDVEGLPHTSQ